MKHESPQNQLVSNLPTAAGKPRTGRQATPEGAPEVASQATPEVASQVVPPGNSRAARPAEPDSSTGDCATGVAGASPSASSSGTREGILAALGDSASFVSGEALAARLGVSRAAVWKHVSALKRRGYEIVGVRSRGYRLISSPDPLNEESLWHAVRARGVEHAEALAATFVCKQVTASTNSDALALGRRGAPEGTVVIAEEQSSGRGRLGRSWESVRGVNLYMSLLLRPQMLPAQAPQLSLVAGLAVASAIEELGLAPLIKWPNDVVLGGRKVAGILTEIEAEADRVAFVVVGMGVNLNSRPQQFSGSIRDIATSVLIESGRRVDRSAFAASLLAQFKTYYRRFLARGFGAVSDDWERRSMLSGRRISVSGVGAGLRGICVGIDGDGALLLKEDGESGVAPPSQGSGLNNTPGSGLGGEHSSERDSRIRSQAPSGPDDGPAGAQGSEAASGQNDGAAGTQGSQAPSGQNDGPAGAQASGRPSESSAPPAASRIRRILAGDVSIEGAYGRETG